VSFAIVKVRWEGGTNFRTRPPDKPCGIRTYQRIIPRFDAYEVKIWNLVHHVKDACTQFDFGVSYQRTVFCEERAIPREKRTWTPEEIEEKVKEILSDSCNIPKEEIQRSTKLVDITEGELRCCPCCR
jgi:hypothetical protein